MRRIHYKFISFLLIFANFIQLDAQAAFSYDMLLNDLETQLIKGNKRALRDVASLLDKPVYREPALVLLEKYSFFTKSEIEVPLTTRTQFMNFYFLNEQKFKYSEILRAFYLTPVENQPYELDLKNQSNLAQTDPATILRNLIIEFDQSVKNNSSSKILQGIIERIAAIGTPESFQWLRNTLTTASFSKKETDLYLSLCEGLKDEPIEENLNAVIGAAEKGFIPAEFLTSVLIELTNYTITPQQTKQLKDSLESFEALRMYGYDKILPFKKSFFYEDVDYYGKILGRKDTPWIQRNALRDLLKTEHPRLLFFIAAQIRLKPEDATYYEKILKKLTKIQFSLPNTEGGTKSSFQNQIETLEKYKQFVRFWANHSEDYEWDETQKGFVNKMEVAQKTENYERLFRRLSSENDSVALGSFIQLSHGEPALISALTDKFRPLLRNYNKKLPDIRYGYLEQLTRLSAFCQKNNISFSLPKSIDTLLGALSEVHTPQQRYAIENQIIKQSEIKNLTALEYFGCLHSGNSEMALSMGRILDYLYSNFWNTIKTNDTQLRLFLKKCFLFKKIGIVGVCSSYQNKIELDPVFKSKLLELARLEDDGDIINQIQLITGISDNSIASNKSQSMLNIFLNDPLNFVNSDLKLLPPPQNIDYQRIVEKIQSENEREVLRLMLNYLELHPSITVVPNLFRIIGDDRRLSSSANGDAIRVSDKVVALLENIYGHVFKKEDNRVEWRRLWYKNGKNFELWDKQFFLDQTKFLTTADTTNMDDILEVSNSKNVTELHKGLIINALVHLLPFSDIRRFKSKIPLKVSTDLAAFEQLEIAPKDLDDFIKIFDVDSDSIMWRFINKKTSNFSLEELGSFYNSLFKVNWLTNQMVGDYISPYQKELAINVLQKYLSESELLSDFEEQLTLLHIAELQNVGHPLHEKLEATFALEISEESKATIQEAILARIGYGDIPTVARYFEQLSRKPGYNPTAFLFKDFGIPFFNADNESVMQLIDNHKNMKPYAFYKHYLKNFGVDFMKDGENLDFNKIYNILKFEIVAPFTGGGSQRDYFTYGIIKILEFHFKTQLGFNEKLNENQTFYTYSASKRATKWMQFLESKKLVSPDPSVPASFNRLFAGN